MNHHLLGVTLLLCAITLTSCFLPLTAPDHSLLIATIGPVRQGGSGKGLASTEITASTNCAEVGELVIFTARVFNQTTHPVTITGAPLIDIVLKPNGSSAFVQRWSDSDQYPHSINPVLAAGEIRTYQWQWKAEARYAANTQPDQRGVWATLMIGAMDSSPAGGTKIYLGVDTMMLGGPSGHIRCADMRH